LVPLRVIIHPAPPFIRSVTHIRVHLFGSGLFSNAKKSKKILYNPQQ
jgi:hypothetical protein